MKIMMIKKKKLSVKKYLEEIKPFMDMCIYDMDSFKKNHGKLN